MWWYSEVVFMVHKVVISRQVLVIGEEMVELKLLVMKGEVIALMTKTDAVLVVAVVCMTVWMLVCVCV